MVERWGERTICLFFTGWRFGTAASRSLVDWCSWLLCRVTLSLSVERGGQAAQAWPGSEPRSTGEDVWSQQLLRRTPPSPTAHSTPPPPLAFPYTLALTQIQTLQPPHPLPSCWASWTSLLQNRLQKARRVTNMSSTTIIQALSTRTRVLQHFRWPFIRSPTHFSAHKNRRSRETPSRVKNFRKLCFAVGVYTGNRSFSGWFLFFGGCLRNFISCSNSGCTAWRT